MTFTYDLSTDIGRVRRTIPDKDEDEAFWTDEDLQSFIDDEGNWRLASAACLEAMASDSAMVLQVIQVQDLHVDGTQAAKLLLQRAKLIRELAFTLDTADDCGFDVIPMIVDDFGLTEYIRKRLI